jgi:hypothetical protein
MKTLATADRIIDRLVAKPLRMLSAYLCVVLVVVMGRGVVLYDHCDDQPTKRLAQDCEPGPKIISLTLAHHIIVTPSRQDAQ